jgi:branched-chain amino acid transport system substrate-binding protein
MGNTTMGDTTMGRKIMIRWLAALFALAFIAAACGDSDDDTSSTGTDDTQEESTDDPQEESTGGGLSQEDIEDAQQSSDAEEIEEMVDRSTLELLFADAAANRQELVDEITAKVEAGEWGIGDDNILRGPSGFEVDLNECVGDWDNYQGITDTEIRVGATGIFTGIAAAWGDAHRAWQSYWDYINETNGGIDGKELVLIVKDDGYVAAQTIEFFDELIESENILAYHGVGSPNGLAVYDKANAECMPHLFHGTGHPAWGDPVNHPWTTGGVMSYSTEAVLWGTWIKDNLADELPVKVAALVMDNDFGLAYENAFRGFVEANPDVVSDFDAVRHDPASPTVINEVTTIASFDPDVFIAMTGGATGCALTIQSVDNSGLLETLSAAFTASVCKGVSANMTPAGDSAEGWLIVGGGIKDQTDPAFADEPYMQLVRDTAEAAGLDPSLSMLAFGHAWAYAYTETMLIAAELPGGLSKTNLILAARNLRLHNPMFLEGLNLELNGNADAYLVEGSEIAQFDAVNQSWIVQGDVVDANGATANCAYDKDATTCE